MLEDYPKTLKKMELEDRQKVASVWRITIMVMTKFWNGLGGFVASRHMTQKICTGKDVEKDSVKRIRPSVTREEKRFLGVRGSMREWKISSPWSCDVNDPIYCDESYIGQLIVSCTTPALDQEKELKIQARRKQNTTRIFKHLQVEHKARRIVKEYVQWTQNAGKGKQEEFQLRYWDF